MPYDYLGSRLQSPEDLYNYCLRALGSPVINIEIDEQQAYDRIFEAIEFFITRHYDGANEHFLFYTTTQADEDNGYITLPRSIASVMEIMNFSTGNSSFEEFERLNFRLAQTDILDHITRRGNQGLLDYHLTMQNIELYRDYFSPEASFQFNEVTNQLIIQGGNIVKDHVVVLRVFKITDPDEFDGVYNNEFVKRFATALVGLQWGRNIRKYDGVQLPGGLTMPGETIYQDFKQEVEKMKEEFFSKYEEPPTFFMA